MNTNHIPRYSVKFLMENIDLMYLVLGTIVAMTALIASKRLSKRQKTPKTTHGAESGRAYGPLITSTPRNSSLIICPTAIHEFKDGLFHGNTISRAVHEWVRKRRRYGRRG